MDISQNIKKDKRQENGLKNKNNYTIKEGGSNKLRQNFIHTTNEEIHSNLQNHYTKYFDVKIYCKTIFNIYINKTY